MNSVSASSSAILRQRERGLCGVDMGTAGLCDLRLVPRAVLDKFGGRMGGGMQARGDG